MLDRRRFTVAACSAVAAVLALAAWSTVADPSPGAGRLVGAVAFTVAPAVASLAALWRARRERSRGWALLGVSFLMWTSGSAVWLVSALASRGEPTFPSFAEVGYLGYVVPAVAGLMALTERRTRDGTRLWYWVDALVIASSVLFVSWATVMAPAITKTSGDLLTRLCVAGYPVVDVVLASLALSLGMRAPHRERRQWALLGAGIAVLAVTNGVYAAHAVSFVPGTVLDLGWVVAFLLVALAALVPPARDTHAPVDVQPVRVLQRAVPYLPVTLAVVVVAVRQEPVTADPVLVVLGASALALFLARQTLLLVDNTRLTGDLTALVRVRTAELAQEKTNVELLRTVAVAANTASSVDEALQLTLDAVCEHTGWELGHAFLASTSAAGELRSSHVWHVDDPARYERFMRATAVVRLTAGDGLCGRVLATGRPAWSDEVEDQRLSQRTLVQGASLGAGFAVPVLARDELVGVLEFYSTAAVPRDEGLLEVMRYVGTQLGRAVERHRAEDQLRHQAMHDPLTGLPNRVLFAEHVAYAVARHARTSYQVAVLLIDLDGFKKVNDGLGHAVGDELLVHVGQRLRAAARPVDTVARLGGDEFAVLVVDSGDGSVVEGVAAAALDAVAERIPLAGRHVSVTASVGVAVASDEAGDGVEELLRNADLAMYRAKGAGKGRVMFFEPDWHALSFERLELEADLRGALERGELTVHYQPVVELASGRITGTEALLRWDHPTRGSVSPADFIPVAEETSLIRPIGTWVLERAVAQTRRWQRLPGCEGMSVAVNVSVEQLQPGFADSIRDVLERHGVSPESLVIEVTESLLLDELALTVEAIHEISALGVRVAVDDFGTGYSALHRLRQLPVDVLKVDRSFVAQLGDGAGDPLVTAMIALGHGLGLTVVAEGVETAQQLRFLRQHGCDDAQGFLFAAALPPDRLAEMLGDSVTQEQTRAILADAPVLPRDRLDADLLDVLTAAMRGSIPLETAVRPILAKLEEITGLESTYVTRIAWDEGTQRIAVVRNAGTLDIPEGAVVQWEESLCQHVVDGTVSTDDAPARFPASTAAIELGIRSYTGVPITTPRGTVYGTLCGASVEAVPQTPDTIALMELFARVIGQVVSGDPVGSGGSVAPRGQAPRGAVARAAEGAAVEAVH